MSAYKTSSLDNYSHFSSTGSGAKRPEVAQNDRKWRKVTGSYPNLKEPRSPSHYSGETNQAKQISITVADHVINSMVSEKNRKWRVIGARFWASSN